MPLDPQAVFSHLQPQQPIDPLEGYKTLQALRTQQLNQADIASQIQERQETAQQRQIANQKSIQASKAIQDHISGGGSLDDDELINKLAGIDPTLAQNMQVHQAGIKKTAAETREAAAKATTAEQTAAIGPTAEVAPGTTRISLKNNQPIFTAPLTDLQKAEARKANAEAAKQELEAGNLPQSFDDAKKRLDAIAPPGDKNYTQLNSQLTNLLKANPDNPAGRADALKQAYSLADTVAKAKATEPIKIEQQILGAQGQAAGATGPGLDLMAEQALNGNFSSRNPALLSKVYQRAAQMAQDRGLTSTGVIMAQNAAKANKEALNTLTNRAALIKTFTDTTNQHAQTLEKAMQGVTDLGASVLNTPIRNLQDKFGGNTKVTAFQAALMPVQNELAKALNGSLGSSGLTDRAREEFQPVLRGGATAGQLKAALDVLREDMAQQNKVYEANKQDLLGQTVVGGGGTPNAPNSFIKPGGALEKLINR